jgi:hypothetical protein
LQPAIDHAGVGLMVDFVLTLLGSRWSGAKAPHRCSGEGGLEKSDGQKARIKSWAAGEHSSFI